MDTLLRDVRIGVRVLFHSRDVTAIAILTLALGIGANTALFSVVNGVLFRVLPFEQPEQLVRITGEFRTLGQRDAGLSVPELFDFRDRSGLFQAVSGLMPISANLTEVDEPERIEALLVRTRVPTRGLRHGDRRAGRDQRRPVAAALWRRPRRDRSLVSDRCRPLHDRRRGAPRLPAPRPQPAERRGRLGPRRLDVVAVRRAGTPGVLPAGGARPVEAGPHAVGGAGATRCAGRGAPRGAPGRLPGADWLDAAPGSAAGRPGRRRAALAAGAAGRGWLPAPDRLRQRRQPNARPGRRGERARS